MNITGNTYEYKKQLSNYGATWDFSAKCWEMSDADWVEFKESFPIAAKGMATSSDVSSAPTITGDINSLLRACGNDAAAE